MIPTIDRIRSCMNKLSLAGLDDFQSHQEFTQSLWEFLSEEENSETTPKELAQDIQGLIRRKEWYEGAVLRSLHIVDADGRFNEQYIRAWTAQMTMLNSCPAYDVLCHIAATWEADESGNFQFFLQETLPVEGDYSSLSVPKWVQLLFLPFPQKKGECITHLTKLFEVLEEMGSGLTLAYYQYFMERKEPELLSYNLPMLRDMHREESEEECEERISKYSELLDEYNQFLQQMQNHIREAFSLAEEMGVEKMKSSALDYIK